MRAHRLTRRMCLLVILTTLLIAACGSTTLNTRTAQTPTDFTAASSDATQTSAVPDSLPTVAPEDIQTIDISSQEDPPTDPAMLVGFSALVVSGVVTEFLESRWTTADGARPANVLDRAAQPGTILTPVVIELDRDPYLDISDQYDGAPRLVILIEGGTRDGITVRHNGRFFQYEIGDHVVVGMISAADPFPVAAYGEAIATMIPDGFNTAWFPTGRYVFEGSVAKNGPIILDRDDFFSQLEAAINDRNKQP